MPHAKPAPATDFAAPDDAPLDLTLLRQHDQGSSLMDRAQRRLATSDAIFARAHALREQAATSALPQEAQLAALDRQSGQLADAERTHLSHRRLRERYDPGEVERSLQVIAAIPDPVRQRESLTQLQASYAAFAFNPEIAQRLDRQFAEFEPVVQRREGAALRAAILAGRYAPTLADARQIYPGRKINTMLAPGSNIPVFVPERFADPDLEAEAVQVIQNAYHLAQVTGKRTHLEAALDDSAVRQVSRIPGNRASIVFERALEALISAPLVMASSVSPQQPSPGDPLVQDPETISNAEVDGKAEGSQPPASSLGGGDAFGWFHRRGKPPLYGNRAYPPPDGSYRVGNIYFQNEGLKQDYIDAREYLVSRSPLAAKMIEYLEAGDYPESTKAGRSLKIFIYDGGVYNDTTWVDSGSKPNNPNAESIMWNPRMGIETRNGGAISPAMALLHEFGHMMGATKNSKRIIELLQKEDPDYTNMEERRVVEFVERRIIEEINASLRPGEAGEGLRSDHDGRPYTTDGVSSRTRVKSLRPFKSY